MFVFYVGSKLKLLLTLYLSMQNNTDLSFAMIIDGETLANVFEHDLVDAFRDLALKCDSVLCCRMSPSQKALVNLNDFLINDILFHSAF